MADQKIINSSLKILPVSNGVSFDSDGSYTRLNADTVLRIGQRVEVWGGGASGNSYLDVRNTSGIAQHKFNAEGDSYILTNLGIGTTSPDNKFHVVSGSAGEVAQFTGAIENRGLSIRSETNTDASAHVVFNSQSGGSKGMFTFETDGSERMRIDSSGNLGIGTTSPSAKLESEYQNDSTSAVSTATAVKSVIDNNNSVITTGKLFEGLYQISSGSGEVNGNYTNATSITLSSQEYNGDLPAVGMVITAVTGDGFTAGTTITGVSGNTITVSAPITVGDNDNISWESSITNKWGLYISGATKNYISGNVGIGTTSPAYPLDFPTNQSGAAIRIGDDNVSSYIMFSRPRGYVGFDSAGYAVLQGGATKGVRLNVGSNTFGNGTALQISDNGNVGIGTTSPSQKLEVNGVIESPYLEFKPIVFYDFNSNTTGDWNTYLSTLSTPDNSVVRWTTTGTDPNLNRSFDFDGGENYIIKIRYKVVSGTPSSGEIFYATSGHSYSASYYKSFSLVNDGNWHTLVLDMSSLSAGGTDWIDSTITNIRFDLTNASGVAVDIDWISIGGNGYGTQYFEDDTIFDGNVGIGTTNPGKLLELKGGPNEAALRLFDDQSNTWDIQNSTLGKLDFIRGSSNTYMRIDQFGNVGIDQTNPTYRLTIGNNGGLADSIKIGNYEVAANTRQYIGYARQDTGLFETSSSGNTPSTVLPGVAGIRIVNTTGSVLSSKADQSVQLLTHIYNGNSRVALHANYDGNVGIGTTNPQAKLHVANGTLRTWTPTSGTSAIFESTANNRSFVTITGANEAELWFGNASTQTLGRIRYEMAGNNMEFWTSQGQKMVINSAGNVGIGNTTPSTYKLDVVGTIRATGDVIAFSDIRVKENIKTIDNALDKVKSLRGVEYNKIDNPEKSIGVIAQEIEEVIPEVVKEDDQGMKSVAYGNITAVLIEAIKEQQKQIDELKNQLDAFTK